MQTLSLPTSMFELAAKKPRKPEPVKNITVRRSDNGGYIVSYYDADKEIQETYEGLKGVTKCLEKTFDDSAVSKGEQEDDNEE